MKLPDKIIFYRKKNGWSQEDLAEKLYVSRQAISRWENGTALPDAQNILQISKLFNVTTDYLLNDDYESDNDIPIVKTASKETKELFSKKKRFHLISAIAFSVSTVFAIMGLVNSINKIQLWLTCFTLSICACSAVLQFVLFLSKNKTSGL